MSSDTEVRPMDAMEYGEAEESTEPKTIEEVLDLQSKFMDMGPVSDWYHEYVADLIYQSTTKDKNYEPERMVYLFRDPDTKQSDFIDIAHAIDAFELFEKVVANLGIDDFDDRKRMYDRVAASEIGDGAIDLLSTVEERDVFRTSEPEVESEEGQKEDVESSA